MMVIYMYVCTETIASNLSLSLGSMANLSMDIPSHSFYLIKLSAAWLKEFPSR